MGECRSLFLKHKCSKWNVLDKCIETKQYENKENDDSFKQQWKIDFSFKKQI